MNISKHILAKIINEKYPEIPQYEVSRIINFILHEIVNQLCEGNNITFRNFGTFTMITRESKIVRHPTTKELMKIPQAKIVKFIPSKKIMEIQDNNSSLEDFMSD